MIHGKKIVVVLPAYQAEKTIERTFQEIPNVVAHILNYGRYQLQYFTYQVIMAAGKLH